MISVSLASPEVVLDGPATVTASVTNAGEAQERVVLVVVASAGTGGAADGAEGAADSAWATVDRPLREIGAGATEQYAVAVAAPGAPTGTYELKLIAHPAAAAPEEYADRGQVLRVVVPTTKTPPRPRRRWWPWVLAGVLLLVAAVGVVVAVLLRTPEPAVVSQGTATLVSGSDLDLDTGTVDPPSGADVGWMVLGLPFTRPDSLVDPGLGLPPDSPDSPDSPGFPGFPDSLGLPGGIDPGFLVPRNGAGLAPLIGRSIDDVTAEHLQGLSYSGQPVLGADLQGGVRSLAFVTDEGRHGAVEVEQLGPRLSIRWVRFG